jgi:hypothetical protein
MTLQEGEDLQTVPIAYLPPHIIRQFQEDLTNAAKALLICLGTDRTAVEIPTEDGGMLAVEVLHLPASGNSLKHLAEPMPGSASRKSMCGA